MPSPKGQELGLRKPYSLRVGSDIERFRGTNTHGDPGSIGRDQFQALENVSFDGTRWGSRDGLSKVNSAAAMVGCVFGLWDDDDGLGFGGGVVRLYGSSVSADGGAIYVYDSELTTPGQQFKQNPLESAARPQAVLDVHEEFAALRLGAVAEDESAEENLETRFFIGGTAGRVYAWVPTVPPEGRTLLDTATYPEHILTIPGLTTGTVLSLAWWEGVLYVLVVNGSDCEVYSYDGETVTLEVTISSVSATNGVLGVWNGEILCACNGSKFRVRDVTGTWSTLSPPAGELNTPYDIAEYGANAYIGAENSTSDPTIVKYDGTSLTTAHQPPDVNGPYGGPNLREGKIVALAVFDGKLCYFYDLKASEERTKAAFVGTYDGSTWSDTVKTFLGGADLDAVTALGMVVSKASLVVMLSDNPDAAGDTTVSLQAAPGTNIAGTWTTLDSEAPNVTLGYQFRNGGLTAA